MIEILKKGTKNKITCGWCEAELSYQKEDIKESMVHVNPFMSHKIGSFIICPCCGTQIVLEGTVI